MSKKIGGFMKYFNQFQLLTYFMMFSGGIERDEWHEMSP